MSAQHTPGPYTVEPRMRIGRRGGEKRTGWAVVRDGKLIALNPLKRGAQDEAAALNAKVTGRAA